MPLISIVIVTWNSRDVLEECVSSLFAHVPASGFELVLVDNGSNDPAYLEAYTRHENVRVILNGENLGFSKAVNIGWARATGDYFLVLNPDMVFLSNPFPRLIRELQNDPRIGAIGPLLHGDDGRPQIEDFYPNLPTIGQYVIMRSVLGAIPFMKRLSVRWFHARIRAASGVQYVEQIPGAFLFFRRNLFGQSPPLNEAYFIWMEDVDFCKRLRLAGLEVAVVLDEKITHFGGTSFKKRDHAWRRLIFMKSYLTYVRLHSGLGSYLTHISLMALNSIVIAPLYLVVRATRGPRFMFARMAVELRLVGMIVADAAANVADTFRRR